MRARDDDRLQSFRWLRCLGSTPQAAAPSTKRPECVLVFGAGSEKFNGIYVAEDAKSSGGTLGGKSSAETFGGARQNRPFKFRKLDGEEALVCYAGFWILNEGGTGNSMYGVRMMMLAMTPPETGWQVKCGRSPAPRLVTFSELGRVPAPLRQPGGHHLSVLEVRGAGSAAFNGKYHMYAVRNGTAAYRKEDGPHVIVHEQDWWLLSEAAGDESRYGFHCPVAGLGPPEDAVWSFRGGRVPAPVVRQSGAPQEEPDDELRRLLDAQELLEGHWQSERSTLEDYTAAICGTSLTWWNGRREDILFDLHGKVSVLGKGRSAELQSTAPVKLIWSTGDVWTKVHIASPDPGPWRAVRKQRTSPRHALSSSFGSDESLHSSFGGDDALGCDGLGRFHDRCDLKALIHTPGKRDARRHQVDSCSTRSSSLATYASVPSRASTGMSLQPSAVQVASLADEVCGSVSTECLEEQHLLDSVPYSKKDQRLVIDSVEDASVSDHAHTQSSVAQSQLRSADKPVHAQEDQRLVIDTVEDVQASDQAHTQSNAAEPPGRLEDMPVHAQELQQVAEDPVALEENEAASLQPGVQGFVSQRVMAFSKPSRATGKCGFPYGPDHGAVSELVREHQRFISELTQGSWTPPSFQAAIKTAKA